jgi:hypothetical protein
MSNWVSITDADLLKTKMAPLMEALRTAAIADGQEDPVDEIRADVIVRVRNKVATCSTNKVDAVTTTIPASLKGLACRMIVREAQSRLQMGLTDDEREEMRVDERELTAVARCELVVEQPEDAVEAPVQAVQPGPTISGRAKRYGRESQDGV